MSGKLVRIIALVLLVVLIAVLPGLVGCAKEKEEAQEVIIGFIGDFTGPAAATCGEMYKGLTDYFRMVEEDDPITGVEVKIITYDTRMDYARGPVGYLWLKGQGTDIFFDFSPIFQEILMGRHQEDEISSFTLATSPAMVGEEWVYSFSIHYPWEAEAAMKWILEDWEGRPEGRPPKVGHIGISGYVSTEQVTEKLEELHALDPDSFELEEEAAPSGTTAWAVEISRLKDCDIIIVDLLGPQTASFLDEAIVRGYEGTFLGTSLAFLGFWDLVKARVSQLEDLDGALAMQTQLILTDDVPFVNQMRNNLQRFRPDEAETLGRGTSYMAAQAAGLVLADTIRRAVAEVGAENVDAVALNNALKSIDIKVEGYGEDLKCHEGSNILHRMVKVIEYRAAEDDWFAITDWFLPPSLTAD
jgi:hypothetical protein